MGISLCYLLPPIPEGLDGLAELALDLRWSWIHAADELRERIDSELWAMTRNPWLNLQTLATTKLEKLAGEPSSRDLVKRHLRAHREALNGPKWFQQIHADALRTIAYFTIKFGLSEALLLYSGGGRDSRRRLPQDRQRSRRSCGGRGASLPAGLLSSGPR